MPKFHSFLTPATGGSPGWKKAWSRFRIMAAICYMEYFFATDMDIDAVNGSPLACNFATSMW